MKKLFCLILALLMVIGLVGCGEAAPESTTVATTETTSAPAQATEETTAPTEFVAPEPADPLAVSDYTPYLCPWTAEDLAKARSDGKMHYFFMAAEGLYISLGQQNADKWGDSTLVVFPNGELMLIDCGPSKYGPVLLRNLQQMGVERLDYIFVSHPHSDHQNGAFDEFNKDGGILDVIGVDQVYWRYAGAAGSDKDWMVGKVCEEKNIPCQAVAKGTVLEFGDVTMKVLWPREEDTQIMIPAGDINDKSIVHRFDFKEHSAIFSADLYFAGEEALLADIEDPALLDADFLKVPHHGHATSSSPEFIAAVSPELSVAMARVPIVAKVRDFYSALGSELLYDLVNGYIHVTADADGNLEYTTTRNHDPNRQAELNTPSATLKP